MPTWACFAGRTKCTSSLSSPTLPVGPVSCPSGAARRSYAGSGIISALRVALAAAGKTYLPVKEEHSVDAVDVPAQVLLDFGKICRLDGLAICEGDEGRWLCHEGEAVVIEREL